MRGALVGHLPQGQEEGCRPGAEQPARQPEQLVAGGDDVDAGDAGAEDDQVRRQLEVVEVVERQVGRGAEADPGEHRVVRPEEAVRGDVEEASPGALLAQDLLGGLRTDVELRARKARRHGSGFVEDERRLRPVVVGRWSVTVQVDSRINNHHARRRHAEYLDRVGLRLLGKIAVRAHAGGFDDAAQGFLAPAPARLAGPQHHAELLCLAGQ